MSYLQVRALKFCGSKALITIILLFHGKERIGQMDTVGKGRICNTFYTFVF